MRFARWVFIGAGIWGLAVLSPLFGLIDVAGRHYAEPAQYPQFFYGFIAVAMAWQLAFLVIGSDPVRFRPLMLPAVVEKLGWVVLLVVLYAYGYISDVDLQPAVPDGVLGALFIVAYVRVKPAQRPETSSP